MSKKHLEETLEKIKTMAAGLEDSELKQSIDTLVDLISVGNISNSTGVAIGRNIRMVINQFGMSPGMASEIIGLRNVMGLTLGLVPNRYQLDTFLIEKTHDFVGRTYVFEAIYNFLLSVQKGYLIIQAKAGMGKSAILAQYVLQTGCIAHFNIRAIGITSTKQFLENICTQLVVDFGLPYASLPDDATENGVFLSKLLREASQELLPGEQLVIAVDALDEVVTDSESTNILCLPPTLPDGVYFVLTKRSDAWIHFNVQSPLQTIDLKEDFSAESREDIETYILKYSERPKLGNWLTQKGIAIQTFLKTLGGLSEDNFMYLRYVLPEIENGSYQNLDIQQLPMGLEGYYEDHWFRMGMIAKPLPRVKIHIIYIMCEVREPISRQLLSDFASNATLQIEELTVQEVLDEWRQFLLVLKNSGKTLYSIYHASFRDFLHRKDIVQAVGINLKDVKKSIVDNLWSGINL